MIVSRSSWVSRPQEAPPRRRSRLQIFRYRIGRRANRKNIVYLKDFIDLIDRTGSKFTGAVGLQEFVNL